MANQTSEMHLFPDLFRDLLAITCRPPTSVGGTDPGMIDLYLDCSFWRHLLIDWWGLRHWLLQLKVRIRKGATTQYNRWGKMALRFLSSILSLRLKQFIQLNRLRSFYKKPICPDDWMFFTPTIYQTNYDISYSRNQVH